MRHPCEKDWLAYLYGFITRDELFECVIAKRFKPTADAKKLPSTMPQISDKLYDLLRNRDAKPETKATPRAGIVRHL